MIGAVGGLVTIDVVVGRLVLDREEAWRSRISMIVKAANNSFIDSLKIEYLAAISIIAHEEPIPNSLSFRVNFKRR
jgi:hypothetical protein